MAQVVPNGCNEQQKLHVLGQEAVYLREKAVLWKLLTQPSRECKSASIREWYSAEISVDVIASSPF